MTEPWLSTTRLALRRLTPDDFDWVLGLFSDPAVTRYLGGPFDRPRIESMFKTRIIDYYEAHPGLGIWMTLERATGAPVGCHLVNHIQGESIVQIGYFLARDAWGKGYATEMALALLRYAFEDLRLPLMCAMTAPANVPSQQVLLKIGLKRRGERTFSHPAYPGPQAWFERDAGDWLQDQGTTLEVMKDMKSS